MSESMPTKKIKKTEDINAYMREYRLKNLEKIRKQDNEQYHANKYKTVFTPEEIELYRNDLETAYKYKKMLIKSQNLLLSLLKRRIV
jgi:pantothenate synthetase